MNCIMCLYLTVIHFYGFIEQTTSGPCTSIDGVYGCAFLTSVWWCLVLHDVTRHLLLSGRLCVQRKLCWLHENLLFLEEQLSLEDI